MNLTGEQKLALPRDRVWQALNDPEILRRSVPGCDTFEREADDRYKVGMAVSVGPVKARFTGKLTLSDIQPPTSYSLTFEGSGGAAGFGKGNAHVVLADDAAGTLLRYTMDAQVGGKLAQVGARLIDGVSRKIADEFFSRFARAVQGDGEPAAAAASAPPAATPAPPSSPISAPGPAQPLAAAPQGSRSLTASLAILGAAVSAAAASVAVLAAAIALYATH